MVNVRGYRRRDGTWVRPHTRRSSGRRSADKPSRGTSNWSVIPTQRANSSSRSGQSIDEATRRRLLNDRIVKSAAEYCAAIIKDGTVEATVERVADYATKETWNFLKRKWRRFRCRWLNELANAVLAAKKQYHQLTVAIISKILSPALRHKTEQQFAMELARNIPLPGDSKFTAIAQGIRIVGVGLCVAQDISPERCFCFEALALEFGKEATKKLLIAEGDTWMRDLRNDHP